MGWRRNREYEVVVDTSKYYDVLKGMSSKGKKVEYHFTAW